MLYPCYQYRLTAEYQGYDECKVIMFCADDMISAHSLVSREKHHHRRSRPSDHFHDDMFKPTHMISEYSL